MLLNASIHCKPGQFQIGEETFGSASDALAHYLKLLQDNNNNNTYSYHSRTKRLFDIHSGNFQNLTAAKTRAHSRSIPVSLNSDHCLNHLRHLKSLPLTIGCPPYKSFVLHNVSTSQVYCEFEKTNLLSKFSCDAKNYTPEPMYSINRSGDYVLQTLNNHCNTKHAFSKNNVENSHSISFSSSDFEKHSICNAMPTILHFTTIPIETVNVAPSIQLGRKCKSILNVNGECLGDIDKKKASSANKTYMEEYLDGFLEKKSSPLVSAVITMFSAVGSMNHTVDCHVKSLSNPIKIQMKSIFLSSTCCTSQHTIQCIFSTPKFQAIKEGMTSCI